MREAAHDAIALLTFPTGCSLTNGLDIDRTKANVGFVVWFDDYHAGK